MNLKIPSEHEIIADLNKKFMQDPDSYLKKVESLKSVGYKILRNSTGQHKILYNNNYFNEIFGGVFNGKF